MFLRIAFVVAVLAAPTLVAEPPAPETPGGKPVEETIVVTATRSERSLNTLPQSVTVVTSEQLSSTPSRAVDDLLRSVAGVTPSVISSSGSTPTNQRFSMHGLGGTRALVLLDGIPIHDAYSGIVQWQRVPLDTLRQIEVVRGGNASLFGTFALGGTVNLITRTVDRNLAALDLGYGSFETSRSSIRVDHVLSPALAVRFTHHRNDSSGFDRVPNAGPVDVPAWIDNSVTAARADYTASEAVRGFLNVSAGKFDVSQGTPLTYSKRDVADFSGGIDIAGAFSGLVSAKAFHLQQRERLTNSSIIGNRESEFLSQDATIPSQNTGASLEWSQARSGRLHSLSVGADVRQAKASEMRDAFNRSGVRTQRNELEGRQRFAGVFVQAGWQVTEQAEVVGSTRLDTYANENGFDAVVGGARTVYANKRTTQFDPRVSMRYAIGSGSAIRASAYRAFNAPTLRELYRANQSGNSVILGNPQLEPETLVGAEIGWEWTAARSRVEVNLYHNTIEGLQSRAPVAGQPANVTRYVNAGQGRSRGIETTGSLILSRSWSIDGSYTFADSVITEDLSADLVGKRIAEVPRDAGTLTVRYRRGSDTTAEVRGRSIGRSYGDAANLAKSPAHQVVDVSVTQSVRPWLDLYILGENVFDEEYYLALAVNSFRTGLPRSITAGVRMRAGW